MTPKKKPAAIYGGRLNYNAAVAARYSARIDTLVSQMVSQTRRELMKLFKGNPAKSAIGQSYGQPGITTDADISSQARIVTNDLKNRFQQLFNRKSKGLAEQMIGQANKASANATQTSLKEMSAGLTINKTAIDKSMKTIIKASVAENVQLIRSIPEQYFTRVQGAVMRSITTGNGLQDLVPAVQKYDGITHRRAKLIAEDQTRKVYSNLNFERMAKVGVKKFEWVHSGGGAEPRPLHLELNGQVFSMDDLPVIDEKTGERGIPGQLINCKCVAKPVITFDDAEE